MNLDIANAASIQKLGTAAAFNGGKLNKAFKEAIEKLSGK